jgi:hypothetical protein
MQTACRRIRCSIVLAVIVLSVAACGGDGDDAEGAPDASGDPDAEELDVCALLTDDEIETLLGEVLPSAPGDPESPYPACSWQTGRLIVQVAPGDEIVLAPDQECPPVDLGDEGVRCPGSVQFVTDGSRIIVQTIEDVTDDQLVEVATVLEGKLSSS